MTRETVVSWLEGMLLALVATESGPTPGNEEDRAEVGATGDFTKLTLEERAGERGGSSGKSRLVYEIDVGEVATARMRKGSEEVWRGGGIITGERELPEGERSGSGGEGWEIGSG